MNKIILFTFISFISLNADFLRNDTDNVVIDTKTNLIWSDSDTDSEYKNWKDALKSCEDLEIGFYKDWRIPNYNELYSLVDLDKIDTKIDDTFKNKSSTRYWTSTINVNNPRYVWNISFASGHDITDIIISDDSLSKIRCIHDN